MVNVSAPRRVKKVTRMGKTENKGTLYCDIFYHQSKSKENKLKEMCKFLLIHHVIIEAKVRKTKRFGCE